MALEGRGLAPPDGVLGVCGEPHDRGGVQETAQLQSTGRIAGTGSG